MSSFNFPLELTVCTDKIRKFHTSADQRQMDTAVKTVGSGLAAIGTGTAALGVGYVYGKCMEGVCRNPSLKEHMFLSALIGVAFCEALGLMAFVIGLLGLYS